MEQKGKLYTIGCSTRAVTDFIDVLKDYKIQVVADVRSVPYSHFTPQFNSEILKDILYKNQISYGDFSKEFGARRSENFVYKNDKVDFEKVISLEIFKKGIALIKNDLSKGYSIALMCTEYNPLNCHRFSLVSRGIRKYLQIPIIHILDKNNSKTTEELEDFLLEEFNLQPELFDSKEILISRAYNILSNKIAYTKIKKEENIIYA